MSVVQAISSAGGLYRNRTATATELATHRGELRLNTAEKQALDLRIVRLNAELADAQSLTFPPDSSAASPLVNATLAKKEETEIFNARRQSLAAQIEALSRNKGSGQRQVESLKSKASVLVKQAQLAKEQLQSVSDLAAKGLVINSRQLELQQNASRYQSDLLDIELTQLRASQDIDKTDADINLARESRRILALAELADARAKALTASARIEAAKAALSAAGDFGSNQNPRLSILILRRVDGVLRTHEADETEEIAPGDVVKVFLASETAETAVR